MFARIQFPDLAVDRVGSMLLFSKSINSLSHLRSHSAVIATRLKPGVNQDADLTPDAWQWWVGTVSNMPAQFTPIKNVVFTGTLAPDFEGAPADVGSLFDRQSHEFLKGLSTPREVARS